MRLALDYDCKCETIFAPAQTRTEDRGTQTDMEEQLKQLPELGQLLRKSKFQGCCSSFCCSCWQLAMQRNNFAYCIEMQLRFQRAGERVGQGGGVTWLWNAGSTICSTYSGASECEINFLQHHQQQPKSGNFLHNFVGVFYYKYYYDAALCKCACVCMCVGVCFFRKLQKGPQELTDGSSWRDWPKLMTTQ